MLRLNEETLRRLLVVARELVADLELDRVLRGVLEAAVEVTGARYAALGVLDESREGLESFIHLGIDERTRERIGDLPSGRGVLGILIDDPRPLRLADVGADPRAHGFPEGHPPMRTFLGVPIELRGEPWGNLYLTEKRGGEEFDEADEASAVVLAQWAAVAIGNARSVAAERLQLAIEAAEQERLPWARELHDQTLQGMAALRLLLATWEGRDHESRREAIAGALQQIDTEIAALRALISDLRPDSLDELGIEAALEGLAARMGSRHPQATIRVDVGSGDDDRLPAPLELAVYRVAQEAITNAVRHGESRRVLVLLERDHRVVTLRVADDGGGFDPDSASLGFGILGMQERAELAGGELEIESRPGAGAVVELRLPLE
jgi:signal transduction histidine kinase